MCGLTTRHAHFSNSQILKSLHDLCINYDQILIQNNVWYGFSYEILKIAFLEGIH